MGLNLDDKTVNFLEELSWLLKSYPEVNILSVIEKIIKDKQNSISVLDEYRPNNPNIAFLVGTLPGLFMNTNIFPVNEEIAIFAEKSLGIRVTRPGKRSKYELIGLIVCEVTKLNDKELTKVVKTLKPYVSDNEVKINDWNKVINVLINGEDNE